MPTKTIYDGADLIQTMKIKIQELSEAEEDARSAGVALAMAERDYKIVLNQWTLRLKNQGYAMTMIEKAIYGVKEVANARYDRDVAEVIYKAAEERINCTKLEIRVLENQITREYGRGNQL